MTLDEFMSENYEDLLSSARKISQNSPLSDELLHYALDEFLHKENCDDILQSGGAQFYLVRIMLNSWRSTTSPFYRNYRKPSDSIEDHSYLEYEEGDREEIEELAAEVQASLNSLSWFERELLRVYIEEGHNMSSLSRATKIPRTTISLTINRVRTHIKNKINP